MKRRLRDEVVEDLTEAAAWYDDHRPGLGSPPALARHS
jgi:hypothetical protein